VRHRDAGEDLVLAAGELQQHLDRVARVARLAEHVAPSTTMVSEPTTSASGRACATAERLLARQPLGVVGRHLVVDVALVDLGGPHLEVETQPLKQLRAARRLGGQDQGRDSRACGYVGVGGVSVPGSG
jgi:hypothetical protein